jgi:hypothetical protein
MGEVHQTIHLTDPAEIALTAIAGINGQRVAVDGKMRGS